MWRPPPAASLSRGGSTEFRLPPTPHRRGSNGGGGGGFAPPACIDERGAPADVLGGASAGAAANDANDGDDCGSAARLEPVFLNKALRALLDARTLEDYAFTMEKQLLRNPQLALLFENSVRRLLAGRPTRVRQHVPHFTSPATRAAARGAQGCSFLELEVVACGYLLDDAADAAGAAGGAAGGGCSGGGGGGGSGGGAIVPALFLSYAAPASQLELLAQLKRDYVALAHIPSIVTVVAGDGRVLHQNGALLRVLRTSRLHAPPSPAHPP